MIEFFVPLTARFQSSSSQELGSGAKLFGEWAYQKLTAKTQWNRQNSSQPCISLGAILPNLMLGAWGLLR